MNDGIILDGYGYAQNISWQMETECPSLLIRSSVFDLENGPDDFTYLYIGEEDSKTNFTGDSPSSHTTNTGDVTISFYLDSYSFRKCLKKLILNIKRNFKANRRRYLKVLNTSLYRLFLFIRFFEIGFLESNSM